MENNKHAGKCKEITLYCQDCREPMMNGECYICKECQEWKGVSLEGHSLKPDAIDSLFMPDGWWPPCSRCGK